MSDASSSSYSSEIPADSAFVEYALHVGHPPVDAAVAQQCEELKQAVMQETVVKENQELAEMFITQQNLHRYLRARNFDQKKSKQLLLESFTWRAAYKPHLLRAADVEAEHNTGKILVLPQRDRHGRPIIVMDSSRENSKTHDSQVRHLVWQLERARRHMNRPVAPGQPKHPFVEKYCIFINMTRHSIFNAPPLKTSMETLETLTKRYPEHLGHAIVFQPGMLFSGLWSACKPLMDAKTVKKVLMVRGDCSDGSKNDKLLREVIGDEWKEWCDVPKDAYDHSAFWAQVLAEEAEMDAEKEKAQAQPEQASEKPEQAEVQPEKATEEAAASPAGIDRISC